MLVNELLREVGPDVRYVECHHGVRCLMLFFVFVVVLLLFHHLYRLLGRRYRVDNPIRAPSHTRAKVHSQTQKSVSE